MTPVILIGNNEETLNDYINEYISEKNLNPFSIFRIVPIKEEISIDQIRQLKKDLMINYPDQRLFILYGFDKSGLETQNALLKTLEESTEKNQFILTADNYEKIIPTVRSRSNLISIKKNNTGKTGDKNVNKLINQAKHRPSYEFFADSEVSGIDREKAVLLIDRLIFSFKSRLETEGLPAARVLKKILVIKQLFENNNLNPQLTVDNLLIFIKKTYSINVSQKPNGKK